MQPQTAKATAADAAFREVVQLIQSARQRATQVVNIEMIDLCWRLGEVLHHRIEADGWGKGTVVQLAACIARRQPGRRGFSAQNLWRTRQFFEAYRGHAQLSTLLRALQPEAGQHFKDAYLLQLPGKQMLAAKLHGFYALNAPDLPAKAKTRVRRRTRTP